MPRTVATGRHAPSFVEHIEDVRCSPGRVRRCTIQFLVVAKALTADVCDREMCERKIAQVPAAPGRRIRGYHAHSEECHFKSIPPPLLGPEVAGEVPPLSLVFVMASMVPRKLEVIAAKRRDKS